MDVVKNKNYVMQQCLNHLLYDVLRKLGVACARKVWWYGDFYAYVERVRR